jgi:hypothetical protein
MLNYILATLKYMVLFGNERRLQDRRAGGGLLSQGIGGKLYEVWVFLSILKGIGNCRLSEFK